jgi:nucleotide-binding universal stress UspA family protein
MFEKILVCLDGSEISERILPYITDDAKSFHSAVVLLRVVHLPGITVPLSFLGEPGTTMQTTGAIEHMIKEQNNAGEYLEKVTGILGEKGLKTESVVLTGTPGETITRYAQENGFTLIAIATHGHGGLRRLALGSTAEFVLHHSSLPLLMVTASPAPIP